MTFKFTVNVHPSMFGVVVNKNGRIPASIETAGSSMETLGAFVEQHVAVRQYYLVSISIKVLDKDRPRL